MIAPVDIKVYPLIWELAQFLDSGLPEKAPHVIEAASYKLLSECCGLYTISKSNKVTAMVEFDIVYKEVYVYVGTENLNDPVEWDELSSETKTEFVKCFVLPLLATKEKILEESLHKKLDNSQKISDALKATMTEGQ